MAPLSALNQFRDAAVDSAELTAGVATADRESADYEAQANQESASRTNSLAQRLASARRTPGGGIRLGMRKKGLTAGSATSGLTAANSKQRRDRRVAEVTAQAGVSSLNRAQGNLDKHNAMAQSMFPSLGNFFQ